MKATTIQHIKQELQNLKPSDLSAICLRLARFKKENKELLTYLLFEAQDEAAYIVSVKKEIDVLFQEVNLSQLYFAKKTLRKIARVINKYSRFSGEKPTEIELRIHFCVLLHTSGIPLERNTVILNLFHSQLKKINLLLSGMHEDLQYDYRKQLGELTDVNPVKKKSFLR